MELMEINAEYFFISLSTLREGSRFLTIIWCADERNRKWENQRKYHSWRRKRLERRFDDVSTITITYYDWDVQPPELFLVSNWISYIEVFLSNNFTLMQTISHFCRSLRIWLIFKCHTWYKRSLKGEMKDIKSSSWSLIVLI